MPLREPKGRLRKWWGWGCQGCEVARALWPQRWERAVRKGMWKGPLMWPSMGGD